MQRLGSSTGNGAGWFTREARSVAKDQMDFVCWMKSSRGIVSRRPLLALSCCAGVCSPLWRTRAGIRGRRAGRDWRPTGRNPKRRRNRRWRIVPDDLPAHQEANFGHDDVDVGRERDVRFSSKLATLTTIRPPGVRSAVALRKHVVKQRQVFLEREILVVILGGVVGR